MRYLGGKFRIGKQIAGYLNLIRKPGQAYAEPFVGAANVTQYINAPVRYAYDKHAGMIALWRALQDGWLPPDEVSEMTYKQAQAGEFRSNPALETFILIGCSFGGKWSAGYARGQKTPRNFADVSRRGLLHKLKWLRSVQFAHADFFDWQPPEANMLIYCDPPYAGTEGYDGVSAFDNAAFWQRIREFSATGHDLYVSEYRAPTDMISVLDMPTKTDLRNKADQHETRMERLFSPHADAMVLQPMLL